MCGICGVINNDLKKPVSQGKIKEMTDLMSHRGPDGEGSFLRSGVGLGHRRLAIIDLSDRAKQPMSNEKGDVCITFNGEIYNFRQIRQELKGKYSFRTESDTEVILKAYEEWGVECLGRLRGMFAFAIYDFTQQRLFAAVDHSCQKPFIYYQNPATKDFYFASEIKPILAVSGIKKKINLKALHLYFLHNYRHIPHPHTIFENIFKLPPASYLILDGQTRKLTVKQYWRPSFIKRHSLSEKEYFEQYRFLARESIDLVNVADVPVGVFLSGGIDSSTIAALSKVKDFSSYAIGLHKNDPELLRAGKIAKLFKSNHSEIIFDKESFNDVETLIGYLGEPLNLLPALHLYRLSKEAKKKLKVMISGNGADEIFYGYDGSNRIAALSYFLKFPFLNPTKVDCYSFY